METDYFTIDTLIKTELPPLPGNVLRISAMLGDYNISQNTIAKAISLDPVLASRILRLANSAAYGQGTEVTNLSAAVTTVGNRSISEILLISGLSDCFGRKILSSSIGKEIWIHLLSTAMAASDMCHLARMNGADEAFTAGLLHDIGKLILLRADAPFYSTLLERAALEGNISQIEHEIFGFDHAELGAVAAEKWNLPSAISDIIRFHHTPLRNPTNLAIGRIINIADTFVYLKNEDKDLDDLLFSEVVLGFGFSGTQFEALWEDLLIRLEEVSFTFN